MVKLSMVENKSCIDSSYLYPELQTTFTVYNIMLLDIKRDYKA